MERDMYSNPQKLTDEDVGTLRRDAGHWLKQLREAKGLSQRDLAEKVGVEYYTFISQVESRPGTYPAGSLSRLGCGAWCAGPRICHETNALL